jgi:putative spermidine/putrescine transport system permease protein
MILAHGILGIPFVVIPVSTSLANFSLQFEQAARSLGANAWQTIAYVVLPNIKSGVTAGAIFAFVLSWDEIVVTLFISGREMVTVPRRMWSGVREQLDPAVAAVATMFIVATAIAILVAIFAVGRRRQALRAATDV